MRYRTVETSESVISCHERRSVEQTNKFPLEDQNGKVIVQERRATHSYEDEGLEVTESDISELEFDRTLLTENHLYDVIMSIEKHGFDLDDFEFYTQRTHSYKKGTLDPKAVIYIHRISTGIEISYIVGEEPKFSAAFADDLKSGFYEN